MRISKSLGVAIVVVALAGLSMALAVSALGAKGPKSHNHGQGHSGGPLIKESLAPSVPSDPMFHGVRPGNAPWVLKRGDVRLKRDGRFRLRLQGLVIPSATGDNTPGPVNTVSASLYCGRDLDTTAAATTDPVPISRSGDAQINTTVGVPSTCLAPVILVHPNGIAMLYISVTGWRS